MFKPPDVFVANHGLKDDRWRSSCMNAQRRCPCTRTLAKRRVPHFVSIEGAGLTLNA